MAEKEILFYRIRHIPTGLYYKPRKHYANQLTRYGKVYAYKPSLKSIFRVRINWESVKFNAEEWEVVTYELKERQSG